MNRFLCLLALTLLVSPLPGCRSSGAAATAAPVQTPLPDVFGPLDWNTDAARLRARFPEAHVEEGPGTEHSHQVDAEGRELTTWEALARNARLEPFGTVELHVMRFEAKPPAMLIIQRTDSPHEVCTAGNPPQEQIDTCVSRMDRERRALYDELEARLISRFGPGTLHPLQSNAEPTDETPVDPDQAERIWELPGLTLRLAIGMDPRFHLPEMVRLIASRDLSYPYPY
ncbi:hypothetical protein [Stigmatella erecta]|uniref:Lipoprotein n=1 Tax=Stigmatella erecta TaxID=83460 RepID=A0A1I0KRF4_9BACT|nr:hypothetical protein [Stigmatella erecta]SEU28420.1 hypothetical protein SAMN05443639_113159 [Stigmatella erecta]